MNVLDENIPADQREILRAWRIAVRQIGYDLAPKGMKDEQVIPLLLTLRRPTFFTRDRGFYRRELCHRRYCLVVLEAGVDELASYSRRLLHHPQFRTQASRAGAVLRVAPGGITAWRLYAEAEVAFGWAG